VPDPSASASASVPAGFEPATDPRGIRLVVPEGWSGVPAENEKQSYFDSPDGSGRIEIIYPADTTTTPYKRLSTTRDNVVAEHRPHYREAGFRKLAADAAEWEYSYEHKDQGDRQV